MTPKPAPESYAESIPSALRQRDQWVTWKYIERDGKATKVPINPNTGGPASSTDSTTWSSFQQALSMWQNVDSIAGIGFVLTADDPYCGIDLDECIVDGVMAAEAQAIVDAFQTYAEISPSGNGVKLIAIGTKPSGARCRSKQVQGFREIEVYDQGRFFTITGQRLPDTPNTIADAQVQLDDLCHRLWPGDDNAGVAAVAPQPVDLNDEDLLERMFASRNGAAIRALWNGDTSAHGGDDSAADLALCNHLAFWAGRDADRMDRLFRQSGLYRAKWDTKRGARTYGQITIEKALAGSTQQYAAEASHHLAVAEDIDDAGKTDDGPVKLGTIDPETKRLVLSTQRTQPTAKAFLQRFHHHADCFTLRHYAGGFMAWHGNRYAEVEDNWLRQKMLAWMHRAVQLSYDKQSGTWVRLAFPANPRHVNAGLDSLQMVVHLDASTPSPSWLDTRGERVNPKELVPCRTVTLHLPTMQIHPPTPQLFNIAALDFDPDFTAPLPERWLHFLQDLFEDDLQSIELLQEWFGYCLTGDTSQQKMLLVVGPKRAGKGTVARILTRLVGAVNVCGPTTSALAGNFGLQPLAGKSLAIVSDARFHGENISTVVERLLCISGEDTLTVERKHKTAVTMRMPTRFVFLSNELPRFTDSSGALAGRFMMLKLQQSFYGREDHDLENKLVEELPGILNWAIEGWQRLRSRGHFVQPANSELEMQELEDLSSPVGAFVRDCCNVRPGHRVTIDEIYRAWRRWCESDGRSAVTTKTTFGRDLGSAVPSIKRRRNEGGYFYEGIGLLEGGVL